MSHESLRTVLAEWRAAEQRLAEATPGSPGWLEAQRAADAARHRYHQLATGELVVPEDDEPPTGPQDEGS